MKKIRSYAFETLPAGSWSFHGPFDGAIRFIENHQLKDPELWRLFVNQFRKGDVDIPNKGWRGEYWGKMMRGASMTYQYTQDKKLYQVLVDTVEDLLICQDAAGRFSTYSVEEELQEWDMWCRKYILLGLQYFLEICESEDLRDRVVKAMMRHADYILAHVGPEPGKKTITQTSLSWRGLNSSSILEPFVRLHVLTDEKRYLDFAKHIIDNGGIEGFRLFDAAYEDQQAPYQYPVTKAYEMMSCFEGMIWYYRVTGETRYLETAERFARRVMDTDITIIGSAGCTHELFDHSRINQFDPAFDGIMQETCVTVTWMKFCYLLFQITGKSCYAEEIERSAYNALLGAINTEHQLHNGMVPSFDSYSPLRKGYRGRAIGGCQWLDPEKTHYFGCCIAIAAAGTALTALSAVSKTEKGFSFQLYQSGTVSVKTPGGQDVSFTSDCTYPVGNKIQIHVSLQKPEKMELRFRMPGFGKGSGITLNGLAVTAEAEDTFIKLEREWQNGDVVTITPDLPLQLLKDSDILPEASERSVRYAAFLRGPVVLALDSRCNRDGALDETLNFTKGFVAEKEPDGCCFPTSQCYKINVGGKEYCFADYASCGKIWGEAHPMAAWFPVK